MYYNFSAILRIAKKLSACMAASYSLDHDFLPNCRSSSTYRAEFNYSELPNGDCYVGDGKISNRLNNMLMQSNAACFRCL